MIMCVPTCNITLVCNAMLMSRRCLTIKTDIYDGTVLSFSAFKQRSRKLAVCALLLIGDVRKWLNAILKKDRRMIRRTFEGSSFLPFQVCSGYYKVSVTLMENVN